ncbi:low affinity tryptophan permease TnaB [[Enterobacter] lignolyticus]|uniref:Aromatic amino acid permease n=1 Tax=[Enterobacter] lignolyticus TaxID=1334193 RepID=A0A806XIK9_9ENTR|nr:low affinity tryptophan permease TnaB [[Enterobacter] lignolyticus]ALR78529.1 tryptophan permease [[Enterobacter] lignolyticus]
MKDSSKTTYSSFWGVMVIAATVVGGGMFALPVELSGAWFVWGACILVIAWFSMLHSGLLLLEATLNYPVGSSFNTVTKDLMGKKWNVLNGITIAFVLYILTYAYISANGAIISETLAMNSGFSVSPRAVGICTAAIAASILWLSSMAASRVASLFLGINITAFIIVCGTLFLHVDYTTLVDISAVQRDEKSYFPYIFMAIPVCLASFGFHGNIPSLIITYGKRKAKLIKSIVFGSLLALVVYLLWLYCTMGNIPRTHFSEIIAAGGNINQLVKSLIGTGHNDTVKLCLLIFSNLAIASSFFGVTLGLFDYLCDLLKTGNTGISRVKIVLLTFVPPCILYIIFPDGFIYGIGGAGLCATIWAVIIPALLALKSRKRFPEKTFTVWGGSVIPSMVMVFGVVVILCWFGNAFGLLPRLA